jgi:hypothetical protein
LLLDAARNGTDARPRPLPVGRCSLLRHPKALPYWRLSILLLLLLLLLCAIIVFPSVLSFLHNRCPGDALSDRRRSLGIQVCEQNTRLAQVFIYTYFYFDCFKKLGYWSQVNWKFLADLCLGSSICWDYNHIFINVIIKFINMIKINYFSFKLVKT